MKKNVFSRRDFIQKTIGAGVALAGISSFKSADGYNSRGLPTVTFGKTGIRIPRIAIGLGSRYCSVGDEEKGLEILTYALDNGLFYWDTANSYIDRGKGVVSEEWIGKVLKNRRKEVFLSTKIASRDPDEAMRQVETSLRRLQTDYVDNLMIHNIGSVEEVERIGRTGGVIDMVSRLKEQGVTKFIGFSGHSNAEAKGLMIRSGNFDNVLFAMNQYENHSQNREEVIIPAALEKNMGILLMKVVRPREMVAGVNPNELIRFALSLDGPSGLVIGMDSIEVVKSNIEILKTFSPMTAAEMSAFAANLSPFFADRNLEWTGPGYSDGPWG